jgi:hypothetical protein
MYLKYTLQQRAQFILWFAGCQYDYSKFEQKVRASMENGTRIPDLRTLRKWKDDFLETGSVADTPKVGSR